MSVVEHTIESMKDGAMAASGRPSAPPIGWATGPLGAVQAADREIARHKALRFRAVAEFAGSRPASVDRRPGERGAMGAERRAARPAVLDDVSEWAAPELVVALSISQQAAERLLVDSLTMVHRLPSALDALEGGLLHDGHLWHVLDKIAPIADAKVRARVEREVLAWVAGRSVTTPSQFGAKVRRTVLRHDAAAAAQRLVKALRERGVSMTADRREGMALVTALLTVPEAAAMTDSLGRYADALDDPADTRTRGQKMADILLDLVLRPGEHEHGPVRAQFTVVAGVPTLLGGDQPGEIGGEPVPAEMVRALARALGLLPPPGDELSPGSDPAPADPDLELASDPASMTPDAWAAADERWWAEVEARALRGEWRGEEAPPQEVLERMWAQEAAWREPEDLGTEPPSLLDDVVAERDLDAISAPPAALGAWAIADGAVAAAGSALLELDDALARARRSVADAERADAATDDAWRLSPAGRISDAPNALDALSAATAEQRSALADLLQATAGGGLVDRPRIAVVDELTGALLALTDAGELCRLAARGAGLGPPGSTNGYRPSAKLDRFVRARDRRCRFPGCRRRVPLDGELDHHDAWPQGATSATNLTGFCTGHHRGKHQAPGWTYALAPDGALTVTTPTGLVAATRPAPY
jgi:Domain of unknown function (DUF222)